MRPVERKGDMDQRSLTVRIDTDLADTIAYAAKVESRSVNEEIRVAIREHLEKLRSDPEFQEAMAEEFQYSRSLLDKLATT